MARGELHGEEKGKKEEKKRLTAKLIAMKCPTRLSER